LLAAANNQQSSDAMDAHLRRGTATVAYRRQAGAGECEHVEKPVVTLGREARVEPVAGTDFENWDTDKPSERGIDGIERMRLVCDDTARRVNDLLNRIAPARG
jgi:hypothetical protein